MTVTQSHIEAHKNSSRHRDEILSSELCGCFYCLKVFSPSDIMDWVDETNNDETAINQVGQTALCPHCGIDSVIGSKSGFPITSDFLKTMKSYWF